ncbi:MAG: ABC transporter permease [Spirochaetaceae bacterium]|nr:ABC transporter permease [Spirochaetaceae bacterium]
MNSSIDTPTTMGPERRRPRIVDFVVRMAKKKPAGLVFGAVLIFMLFTGIFADRMAPYGMNDLHLDNRLETPSAQFWLGTDQLGRDVLSRLLYGARISVIVSLSATTICIFIAALIGVPSGFLGGKFDVVVQRVVDALMAFPGLLLLITVMSLVGTGALQIILILGFYYGIQNCRVIRSAVIGIKENAYMAAAESIGSPAYRTIARHVIPNIMAPTIIIFTTTIGAVIMSEAWLSFLGYGLPPDVASWGGMLSWDGRKYMELAPALAIWPGLCLTGVVYCANMFGDTLRDLLDPRLMGSAGRYGGVKKRT